MIRTLLLLIILFPALAFGAPSIRFEKESHDFGKANEGDRLEHTFEFFNTGTDELRIEKIYTS